MKRAICFLLILCMLLPGCTPNEAPETTGTLLPEIAGEDLSLYNALFHFSNCILLNIRMDLSQVAKLQEDYDRYASQGSKSPIYRMADLDVTIITPDGQSQIFTIPQVGVRIKGNTSRVPFYNEGEGIYNLVHLKISFQETFDDPAYYGDDALTWQEDARKERKNRTFASLKKLDLKWNRCDDGTYISEHFAYELFRSNDVLAPRTNLASVDWAGMHMGVFTLYEPVDKAFLEKRLPEDKLGGDLYKCGWTNQGATFTSTDSIGIEDEDNGKFYIYDLQTNKKDSTHQALRNFIETLNYGNISKEDIASLVDIDNFLTYAAVCWLTGNPDDLRNNYNNFYLYFTPEGKAMFIPYDYDRCLGITNGWNPTGHGMTQDSPFSLQAEGAGRKQENPLMLYTVCEGGYYMQEYLQILQRISQSDALTADAFANCFWLAEANYRQYTKPGKDFHNAGGYQFTFRLDQVSGNIPYTSYIAAKLEKLQQTVAEFDSSVPPSPQVPADLYIRAEFTGWEIRDGYEMASEGGSFVYRVSRRDTLRLKVFSRSANKWYGTESLAEDNPTPCETDDHRNIILPPGSYIIRFNPETKTIHILTVS